MSTKCLKQGDRFGKLVIISYTDRPNKKGEYKCKCDCGNITYARTSALKSGKHKSCSCTRKESRPDKMLPDSLGIKNFLYHNYKKSAKNRNYEFLLSKEEFINLISKNCYYCGVEPYKSYHSGLRNRNNFVCNGIDRRNNDKGYNIENCVPCCEKCNMAKRLQTEDEFKSWIKMLYVNLFEKSSTTIP